MVGSWTIDEFSNPVGQFEPGKSLNRPELSWQLHLGNGHFILSDRGRRQRRPARPIDLGPFHARQWKNSGSQQCGYRERSLSSLQGRRSANQGAGREGLSFFDCVAARFPKRNRFAKSKGPRFLQPASGRVAGEWHRAIRDAVSLGFAPGASGSPRRVAVPRHLEGICGLCGLCRRAAERSRQALLHDQRMRQAGLCRLWHRHRRPGPPSTAAGVEPGCS